MKTVCILCGRTEETRNHLFFECPYSAEIWRGVLHRLQLHNTTLTWESTLLWLSLRSIPSTRHIALVQRWQACIYEIWKERNNRVHNGVTRPPAFIVVRTISTAINQTSALRKLGRPLRDDLLEIWLGNYSLVSLLERL